MNIGVKLQRINHEDFIWVIYLFIALAALVSDQFEKDYIINNNLESQKKFKLINITVLIIAFFIYIYFVLLNYKSISELKEDAKRKEVLTSHLSLIVSLLFLVAGLLNIIVELHRDTPEEDIGFI